MRARSIKPGFFQNEQLAELPFEARLLFEGLWLMADREGRLEDRPKRIKAQAFPYDDLDAEPLLAGLHNHGLIVRYEVDGARYIEIPKFLDHQRPHHQEKDSVIPPRCEAVRAKVRSPSGEGALLSALTPSSLTPDSPSPSPSETPKRPARAEPDWSVVENLNSDAWREWLAHRRARKDAAYKTLREAQALARYPPDVQRAAIEMSMDKGWTGLFPEKANGAGKSSSKPSAVERAQRATGGARF